MFAVADDQLSWVVIAAGRSHEDTGERFRALFPLRPWGGEGVQQIALRGHFAITLLIVGLDDPWKTDRIQNQDIRHETNEAMRR